MNTQMTENPRAEPLNDDEISLLDLILVLVRHKRILWVTPAVFAAAAIAYALIATPLFKAETSMLPPQQQQSSASMMLAQLGGLAGGAGAALGLKNPNDLYIAMLQSREIGTNLVKKFKLSEWYDADSLTDTLKKLSKATSIESGKDGLIRITVEDRSPELAAKLANAYVEELRQLSKTLAVTEAAQRRLFFEKQLSATRTALADAEEAMKQLQQRTGLLQLETQGKVAIEAMASLRAQITVRQVQLSALKNYATDQNPEVQRLRAELAGLQAQMSKITDTGDSEDALFSRKGMSEAGLEYVRKMRGLKYQEMLSELLSKQFELAKLDEAKDGASIQVLDRATVPERKSKPKLAMLLFLSLCAGAFVGGLSAFVVEGVEKLQKDPKYRGRFDEIKAALKN